MSNYTFKAQVEKVWGSVKSYYRVQRAVLHLRRTKLRDWLKIVLTSKDVKSVFNGLFVILMDGMMISGLLYYFIGFKWSLVLPFGAGWWFFKKDLLVQLRKIISSINLIRIGK